MPNTTNTTLDSEQFKLAEATNCHDSSTFTTPNTSMTLHPTHQSTPQSRIYNLAPPNTAFIMDSRAPLLNIMGFDNYTQRVKLHYPCNHENAPPGGNMFDYTKHTGFAPITDQCPDKTCFVNAITNKFLTSKDLSIILAKLSRKKASFEPSIYQYFHNDQFPPIP